MEPSKRSPSPFSPRQIFDWVAAHRWVVAASICALACVGVIIWLAGAPKPWKVAAADPDLGRLRSVIRYYGWWAAAINAFLLALLAATARWWASLPKAAGAAARGDGHRLPRWFLPLVAGAMAVTLAQGLTRIGQSLWDDEEASVRTYIYGEWQRDDDGALAFSARNWEHTFFNHRRATNHHLQSILSRASHEIWATLAKPEGLGFSETPMRLPVLVAAMGSVAALAFLLLRLDLPRAGVVAAWLLALHPWHIRYAIELRGYIFAICLIPLLLLLLLRALERRSWLAWALYAACGLLMLYAHISTLYALALTNLLALVAIARSSPANERLPQIARWTVSNTLAGMAYLQLMLPCIPQLAAYLASETMKGPLTPRWHANLQAHFFTGIPWNNSDNPAAGFLELRWLAEAQPLLYQTAFWTAAIFLALGALSLASRRPAGWLVFLVFVLPSLFVYVMARRSGNYLYEWYLIPALPGVVAAVACGLDAAVAPLRRLHPAVPWVALLIVTGGYWQASNPARQWLLARSIQPMRESVLAIRPTLDPHDPRQQEILTARLNAPPRSYDPNAISVHTMDRLLALMKEADQSSRPLYVNYGNLHAASVDFPDVFATIENDTYFEKLPTMPGLDPTLERHLRRYRSGSVHALLTPTPQ